MAKNRLQEIFSNEARSKLAVAEARLLQVEGNSNPSADLEEICRAIHSIKGAASVVQYQGAIDTAHNLEERVLAAQKDTALVTSEWVSSILAGLDALKGHCLIASDSPKPTPQDAQVPILSPQTTPSPVVKSEQITDCTISISPALLSEVLGLTGDMLVGWRAAARSVNTVLTELRRARIQAAGRESTSDGSAVTSTIEVRGVDTATTEASLVALEDHILRWVSNSQRLYNKALECRLRPFGDSAPGWHRLVRDLSAQLGKKAQLQVIGGSVLVDRELLQLLEGPLNHLLRNAMDHGIETVTERTAAGKPAEGCITLRAESLFDRVRISISDDGRGLARELIKDRALARGLSSAELLTKMSDDELSAFIFLPGFSTRDTVTEISGRGIGLDVVHTEVARLQGSVGLSWGAGGETTFVLEVSSQQMLVKSMLFRVAGELYALPLASVAEVSTLSSKDLIESDGQLFFQWRNTLIPLAWAPAVLDSRNNSPMGDIISIILLRRGSEAFALAVDTLERQEDLSIQDLDSRLGPIPDVRSAALTERGDLAILLDEDQLLQSMRTRLQEGVRGAIGDLPQGIEVGAAKRILVVDDSVTVRELERKLLVQRGYDVDVACDGAEGLKGARGKEYDLIITDIDMPEMTGIELVHLLKQDPGLKKVPIVIVSYKDREEDKKQGLAAGADAYLTKGSFHDQSFIQTVIDLIGPPNE